jgi:hypothetical protein
MHAESRVTIYARRDGPCEITEYVALLSEAVVARRDDGSDGAEGSQFLRRSLIGNTSRTFEASATMSALGAKADEGRALSDFCF